MKIKKLFLGTLCAAAALVMAMGVCAGCGNNEPVPDPVNPVVPDKTVTETKVTAYEGPSLMQSSDVMSVEVEGQELFVYDTRVNHARSFTYVYSTDYNQVVSFDFEGQVHMNVTINNATSLSDVTIRPLAYGIAPEVSGNVITFTLDYCSDYTLEYNDGKVTDAADNCLHIFANPIEEDPITEDNVPADTIYIGPGVYSASAIPVESGQTIYLAGGAYVYGQIRGEDLSNVTIRGRGILDGEIYDRTRESEYTLPIEMQRCSNVTIEGICILDPAGWAITLYFCDNVTVDNVKIITARANGDGISVQSSSNITVTGGFVRTWDDSLVVKNKDNGTTSDVMFDGVTVWTDLAQSCEVGYETYGASMTGITFSNITILHNYHKAAMSIHNADQADISNVTYSNITLEDGQMLGDNRNDGDSDYLIDMTIAYNESWTQSGGIRGTISNVVISNVNVLSLADTCVCRINGESNASAIKGVSISNVVIDGKRVTSASDLKLSTNTYAKNVTVTAGSDENTGAAVSIPYVLELSGSEAQVTVKETKAQLGMEVPSFAIAAYDETYMGVQVDTSNTEVSVTHGTGTTVTAVYDDGSGSWESEDYPASNLIDGDRSTQFVAREWSGENNEFIAITFDYGEIVSPGIIRIYLPEDSAYVYSFKVSVFVKYSAESENFARALSNAEYEVSPASGNYFDVGLSSTLSCAQLQIRIFRTDGMTAQPQLMINEIKFFPSSLSTNKPVGASDYYDVYEPSNAVDGNTGTYWEASTDEGAYYTVDLGAQYDVSYIVMHLPPILTWTAREQTITIYVSTDGSAWTEAAEETTYLFDPATGNYNSITFETPVAARFVKLVWSYNSTSYGAQLSELYVYGE